MLTQSERIPNPSEETALKSIRTVFRPKSGEEPAVAISSTAKRDAQGRLVVPVYSGFFSSLTENVMCTNVMFDSLKKEIDASVMPYSAGEDILLTVYESSEKATEDVRESVIVGFRRYLAACRQRAESALKKHLFVFFVMFLAGVLIEFFLYGAFPDLLPLWIANSLDIVAWVFIWQFAAYLAFEFVSEIRQIRRISQLIRIEYVFRHWE